MFHCCLSCNFSHSVNCDDCETAETVYSEVKSNELMTVVRGSGTVLPCSVRVCLGVVQDHLYVELGHE
jgi:hypothetical protein